MDDFIYVYLKAFEVWCTPFEIYGFVFTYFDLFLYGVVLCYVMYVIFSFFRGKRS